VTVRTRITYPIIAALALSLLGCSQENPRVATKINEDASLLGELPFNPLAQKVITTWFDRQHAVMSILYGNDVAVQYARTNPQHNYPSGSALSVVTWIQQEDARWFGGNIPAAPKSVEFVLVQTAPDHRPSYSYQKYEGRPLKKISTQIGFEPNERAAYLLSQRAAVMP
jgi:hypothetical protein